MYDSELSDFSDDDDYDALIQQGSASMYRSDSGTQSVPEGAETVFVRDNVTIHPTQYASEGISGRLRLFKQGDSLFMTWIPYKGRSANERLSDKDKNLYSIRDLPFSNVRSIHGNFRRMSWQYVILVTSSGIAFPNFYFYSGGVREFLATIKQHMSLVRSSEDANLFLVNDFQNPLQRTLSSLEIPGAVSVGNLQSPTSVASGAVSTDFQEENDKDMNSRYSEPKTIGKQRQKHHDPARELSIQVLEKFSHVTRFARETTSQIFGESSGDVFAPHETKYSQLIPMNQPVVKDTSRVNEVSTAPNSREMDKLSLVWGKPRQSPLTLEEWNTFFDSEGRVLDSLAARKRIFYGGIEHNLRNEVWPFLLEFYSYDSTFAEREYLMSVKKTEYETLKMQWQSVSKDQAKRFTKFRERKSLIEKDVVRTDRALSFYDGDDNPNVRLLHDILLTYSFYNFDLGYCQGMSDLLSPILYVMRDEAQSFWCFASLMERLGPNFNRDQSGMHSQLFALSKLVELLDAPLHNYFKQTDCLNYFFCFRWILIQFKREFDYNSTMRLWEVLWTHYPSEHLHLYTSVAILRRYRNKIIGEQMTFDALLKFINELSGHIDLDSIIRDAEALCICAGENGAASIPPGTPPSLPIVDPDASIYQPVDDDEVL